jgi:hypothetical protein
MMSGFFTNNDLNDNGTKIKKGYTMVTFLKKYLQKICINYFALI